jgi:hypothetical protein
MFFHDEIASSPQKLILEMKTNDRWKKSCLNLKEKQGGFILKIIPLVHAKLMMRNPLFDWNSSSYPFRDNLEKTQLCKVTMKDLF